MKYKGLIDDQELFQCTFFLILEITAFLGAFVSVIFLLFGIPYSKWLLVILLAIGITAMVKFTELQNRINKRFEEFEAHERKEDREKET